MPSIFDHARSVRFITVCQSCFKTDDERKCDVCHGRGVLDTIPAILANGQEAFLTIFPFGGLLSG